jgi:hypothetical protein
MFRHVEKAELRGFVALAAFLALVTKQLVIKVSNLLAKQTHFRLVSIIQFLEFG